MDSVFNHWLKAVFKGVMRVLYLKQFEHLRKTYKLRHSKKLETGSFRPSRIGKIIAFLCSQVAHTLHHCAERAPPSGSWFLPYPFSACSRATAEARLPFILGKASFKAMVPPGQHSSKTQNHLFVRSVQAFHQKNQWKFHCLSTVRPKFSWIWTSISPIFRTFTIINVIRAFSSIADFTLQSFS